MKFKVGDRVEIVKPIPKEDEIYKGDIVTIAWVDPQDDNRYTVKENGKYWRTCELELVQPKQFTKDDLKERYIVKFRNGEEAVYVKVINIYNGEPHGYTLSIIKNGESLGKFKNIEEYNNDLTNNYNKDYDIISIYKPKYETIWTREEEEIKEMTVAEIEKELGYTIKVIK